MAVGSNVGIVVGREDVGNVVRREEGRAVGIGKVLKPVVIASYEVGAMYKSDLTKAPKRPLESAAPDWILNIRNPLVTASVKADVTEEN